MVADLCLDPAVVLGEGHELVAESHSSGRTLLSDLAQQRLESDLR